MHEKKLAIIGASLFQVPLILQAKKMGLETHVFAWAANDVGEPIADHFYPISITETDEILKKCQEIGIDAICTIGSDLATITVNKVAKDLGVNCNSVECSHIATNKHQMRLAFEAHNVPSPKSILVESIDDLKGIELEYPLIVKPTDRSGSRGINKVNNEEELIKGIEDAKNNAFEKKALVEEFATGQEYSVECVSYHGEHHMLTMTKKYTTGAPHFVETGHLEPAPEVNFTYEGIRKIVYNALDSLQIREGASHTELKVAEDGSVKIIEIGGRMGGDFIGSHLVQLSTGINFVKDVIDVAFNKEPDYTPSLHCGSAVIFMVDEKEMSRYKRVKAEHPEYIVEEKVDDLVKGELHDSSERKGYCILQSEDKAYLQDLMES